MEKDGPSNDVVEVLFRNGDSIEVDAVGRLIGADWILGIEWIPEDDNGDTFTTKNYTLHTGDIRGIISNSVMPIGERGLNARLHTAEQPAEDTQDAILTDLWKAQHQLHPDDDPSAFENSEYNWPQHNKDK